MFFNKLECLYSFSLASKAELSPLHLMALSANIKLKACQSCSLEKLVNYGYERFYKIGSWSCSRLKVHSYQLIVHHLFDCNYIYEKSIFSVAALLPTMWHTDRHSRTFCCTVDLLVLTNLDQLLFIMKILLSHFKTSYLDQEVYYTLSLLPPLVFPA